MLIARAAPPGSNQYVRLRKIAEAIGPGLDRSRPLQWLAIWSMVAAGIAFRSGQADRFVYWEWSGWLDGFLRIILATVIFYTGSLRTGLWRAGSVRLSVNELILHTMYVCALFTIGAIGTDLSLSFTLGMVPYLSLIHISEPTSPRLISNAVFC